ncbi:hypothetical protein BN1007_10252 [Klebsiella variicola]|nr:hypothetical protein BN1007_10252 [Klebsiella variicola]
MLRNGSHIANPFNDKVSFPFFSLTPNTT